MRKATVRIGLGVVVLSLMAGASGQARAELTLTFDNLGVGSNSIKDEADIFSGGSWNYEGLNFTTEGYEYVTGNNAEAGAQDGTDVFAQAGLLSVSAVGGGPFTLYSFDIGLGWYNEGPSTTTLTLNYEDGSSSTSILSLNDSFQTVTLNAADVVSASFYYPTNSSGDLYSGYLALDNITYEPDVTATPEPSTLVSAGIAGLVALGHFLGRKRAKRAA